MLNNKLNGNYWKKIVVFDVIKSSIFINFIKFSFGVNFFGILVRFGFVKYVIFYFWF